MIVTNGVKKAQHTRLYRMALRCTPSSEQWRLEAVKNDINSISGKRVWEGKRVVRDVSVCLYVLNFYVVYDSADVHMI